MKKFTLFVNKARYKDVTQSVAESGNAIPIFNDNVTLATVVLDDVLRQEKILPNGTALAIEVKAGQ